MGQKGYFLSHFGTKSMDNAKELSHFILENTEKANSLNSLAKKGSLSYNASLNIW
jgi:hypothetical protein